MNIKELIEKIINWAKDRNLDEVGTVKAQSIKTAEEIAELIKAISKDNIDLIKDSIGDVFVTLVIGDMLDMQLNLFEQYYQEIKRNAKTHLTEDKKEEIDCLAIDCLAKEITNVLRNGYNDELIFYGLANLIVIADIYNLNFIDCIESAYNEIKDRKGKTVNGQFIKEEDLK